MKDSGVNQIKYMKKINNCSLIAIDCYNYGGAVSSLKKSMAQCEFDKVLFFTDIEIEIEGIEVIKIPSISSKDEYSQFILKEVWKFIDTEFVLVTQHDSWVLNADSFDDGLYRVDYAGALWLETDGLANGNGGFSWRSKKLMNIVGNDPFVSATTPEDVALCRVYRNYLETKYGLVWATDELCEKFAFELKEPNQSTFGFHSFFHQPFKPTVIIKRSGAMGDCIILEPVLRWYYQHGYNVVLDMPPVIYELYSNHYFPVRHISQFDKGRIKAKEINLDLAYEIMPYQNYLRSYFEVCGIKDYDLSKPTLWPRVSNDTKLFNRYVVLHIDERPQPERNVYGVKWDQVINWLEEKGFTVLQIGAGDGGLKINTSSTSMLKFIIAGADLFIGVDSGPSHIAIAHNIPSLIMFGSCKPSIIHADLSSVMVQQNECDKAGCWHIEGGTSGKECFYKGTDKYLQCCTTNAQTIINRLKEMM